MTYPAGPSPQYPQPGPQIRLSLTPVQWLHAATFGLGLILLLLGFAPWVKATVEIAGIPGASVTASAAAYADGLGMASILSFVAGTVALLALLPGGTGRPGPVVPALAIGLTLGILFSIFVIPDGVTLAAGGIIALLFNILLTATAITAYYLDVRRPRAHPPPSPPTTNYPTPPPGPFPPHHP